MTYAELSEAQARRSRQFAEAQTDAMSVYCDAERDLKDLQAENAKLRELVARVEHARRDLCDAYPDAELLNCEECPAWHACRGDLMDRMRELRIEVDG